MKLADACALKATGKAACRYVLSVIIHRTMQESAQVTLPKVCFFDEYALACGVRDVCKNGVEIIEHSARNGVIVVRAHGVRTVARV